MKNIGMWFIGFIIFSIFVLRFEFSTFSSYTKDADMRLENFRKRIIKIDEKSDEIQIISIYESGRVDKSLLIDIKFHSKEKGLIFLEDELKKYHFVKRGDYLCSSLEYIDFVNDRLTPDHVLLYWDYPNEKCKNK